MPLEKPDLSWDGLKQRFKVLQAGLDKSEENWRIRVHRAISWLRQSTELDPSRSDVRFVLLWIAFNSLYSAWDSTKERPHSDAKARQVFAGWLCHSAPKKLAGFLKDQRPALRKLLAEPCLSANFWRNPHDPATRERAAADAETLDARLRNGEHRKVLQDLLDRLYVLRSQIVHGASTAGSNLNRNPVKFGVELLGRFVPLAIHIVLEYGQRHPWPSLCYPPLDS